MKNNLPFKTGKANSLHNMKNILGLNVPDYIVLPGNGVYTPNNIRVLTSGLGYSLAVRSAGSISTPGRMKTFLNVRNIPNDICHFINLIKDSSKSERVQQYLRLKNIESFHTEIIIQNFINSEAHRSGVFYTNGDEFKVEYIFGNGDALMDGVINPMNATVDPVWQRELYLQINKIKQYYGCDVEIEFCTVGDIYYFLQARSLKTVSVNDFNKDSDFDLYVKHVINIDELIQCEFTFEINHPNPDECFYVTSDTLFDDLDKLIRFKGIITTRGGQMCHAAIIARELNIPIGLRLNSPESIVLGRKYTIYPDCSIV